MKKYLLVIIFVILYINNVFAYVWITLPSTNDLILLDDNFKPVKSQWFKFDNDGDGYNEFFFLNDKGIMLKNVTIDGFYINDLGYCEENGKIKKEKIETSSKIITSTIINNNVNNDIPQTSINTGSSNVIMSSNTTSSADTKKALKSNITNKSGIDFVDSKRINNKSWVDAIRFNGNDSYLKAKAENFNELTFEAGLVEISDSCSYFLTIFVNGELLEEFDEEYFNRDENIVVNFDPNSEITITYSAIADEGYYLSTNNKYLYLRNANFRYNKNK